jgi:L-glyceraldehyde 3-phosphate reductase
MAYTASGRSGLVLPKVSLGGWHNFEDLDRARALVFTAIELGITHIDLANNYGPPPGAAETNFGKILNDDLRWLRDELVISTKAGYTMWDGPLGQGGSRKHLLASLDASLRRLRTDYVDIFYSHRYDPATPMEETIGALAHAVRVGKALYAGISNYPAEQVALAHGIAKGLGLQIVIHQCRYSILDRGIEKTIVKSTADAGMGLIAFSPLAQGLLSNRYLQDIPSDSRAAGTSPFLSDERVTPQLRENLQTLARISEERGITLVRLALGWVLRDPRITSVLVGASRPEQIQQCALAASDPSMNAADLREIDRMFPK